MKLNQFQVKLILLLLEYCLAFCDEILYPLLTILSYSLSLSVVTVVVRCARIYKSRPFITSEHLHKISEEQII